MAETGWEIAGKVRMTPKGVYDSTVSYKILDLVSDEGHTKYYIAKQDVPAGTLLTNTTYWDPIMDISDIPDQIEDIESDVSDLKSEIVTKAGMIYEDASGDIVSVNDGADGGAIKALTVGIEPAQAGSGDPSPENVRPITGWTGANIRATGANIWGGTALKDDVLAAVPNSVADSDDDGDYVRFSASNVGGKTLFNHFKPNTQYTIILSGTRKATSTSMNLRLYYTDGTYTGMGKPTASADKEIYAVVSTAGKSVAEIRGANQSGNTYMYYNECGIFEGVLTVADYVPYAGTTYPVSWETEAGTVYGGSVTLNPDGSADVSACPYYASYAGEALAGPWVSSMDVYSAGATPTTGAQVVDLGGTLTTVHVPAAWTPPMLTHLGANSAWADCGPIEALSYPADTKLYVDGQIEAKTRATRSLIAGIETGMTASQAYSAGDLLIVGDVLYKVTAAITSGATFTPETNVTATSVAEQLLLLANS